MENSTTTNSITSIGNLMSNFVLENSTNSIFNSSSSSQITPASLGISTLLAIILPIVITLLITCLVVLFVLLLFHRKR